MKSVQYELIKNTQGKVTVKNERVQLLTGEQTCSREIIKVCNHKIFDITKLIVTLDKMYKNN